MAQTGFTPILIYSSSTAAAAPAAGNLTNSTLGSELAINITDGKLFYKDNANAIQVIGWKVVPTTAGGTGLTSYTAGDLIYYASGSTFTKLGIGASGTVLKSTGSAPSWDTVGNLAVESISFGTTGLTPNTATKGAITVAGTLVASNGGTGQSSYTIGDILYASSSTALSKLADVATGNALISGGVGVAPSWGKIGLTTHVSGTLPTANGGTNLTSFTANGIVYASSTSALATGSALTFDGTNFSTTGSATATRFIPTGSTVATNGMYLPAANSVALSTNSAEVFRMDSSQRTNFGGTSFAANYKFQITFNGGGNNGTYIENTGTGAPQFLQLSDTAQSRNNANDTCSFTDNVAQRWTLRANGGLANYQANNVNLSDRREKTNFAPAKDYLDILCSIPVQTFNYIDQANDDPGLTLGVIAQDVLKVAPEFIQESDWGTPDNPKMRLSIYETDLKYAMLKALQELKKQFDDYVASHP